MATRLKYAFHWQSQRGRANTVWAVSPETAVVEMIITGRGWLDNQGQRQSVSGGSVIWSQAGEQVLHQFETRAPYQVVALIFSPLDPTWSRSLPPRHHRWQGGEPLEHFAHEVLSAYQAVSCDLHILSAYASARLAWSAECARAALQTADLPAGLARVIELIDHRFARPLSIAQLARMAGCGPSHLHAMFRRHLGQTPLDHLTQRRLREACTCLTHRPDMQVQEIAKAVGFPNAIHFGRVFKRQYQVTPLAWRQAHGYAQVC